ncbi:MAG: hypothetical protein U0892_13370 [Pirellulales bacterium]
MKPLIEKWRLLNLNVNIWLDEDAYLTENTQLSPGAIISRYGYWVVGSTAGGNAITLSTHDSAIRFCDHTGWYENNLCFAAKQDYTERPYNDDNVRLAQIVVAENWTQFEAILVADELDLLLDQYD